MMQNEGLSISLFQRGAAMAMEGNGRVEKGRKKMNTIVL